MYKAKLRIPTDMYAYIEIDAEGSPEEIIKAYELFARLWKERNIKKVAREDYKKDKLNSLDVDYKGTY